MEITFCLASNGVRKAQACPCYSKVSPSPHPLIPTASGKAYLPMNETQPNYYNVPEIILSYKTKFRASERPRITCLEETHDIFRQVWDDERMDMVEEGKVLLLNQGNRVIGLCNMSSGGITGTVMDIRHILALALKANATQIVIAHNHPSDTLAPSNADRAITDKLKEASALMDIRLLDHIIICRSGCYSVMTDDTLSAPRCNGSAVPAPQ